MIECDVVLTRDLVPICRHDPELSGSTDVLSKFAQLKRSYDIDGERVTGVFAADLTMEQIRQLRAVSGALLVGLGGRGVGGGRAADTREGGRTGERGLQRRGPVDRAHRVCRVVRGSGALQVQPWPFRDQQYNGKLPLVTLDEYLDVALVRTFVQFSF